MERTVLPNKRKRLLCIRYMVDSHFLLLSKRIEASEEDRTGIIAGAFFFFCIIEVGR